MISMFTLVAYLLYLSWLCGGHEASVFIGTGVNGHVESENKSDILVLGGLFPVHTMENGECGAIYDLGVQTLEAMVLATQMINDDASLLPGVTLAFEIRDTCTLENTALEQSLNYIIERKLEIDGAVLGISGVVGAAFSEVSTSVATLLRLFQVPQISYASTAPSLSDKANFFRTVPPDSLQARAMVDIIEYFNWTYVIIMHTGDIYGREGIRAFMDELENRNSTQKCVATSSSIELDTSATDEDFDRAVEIVNQDWISNATVVVLFVQKTTAVGVLRAVERKRKTDPEFAPKNFTWIGSDGWGEVIPSDVREIARGSLSIVHNSLASNKFNDYFQYLHPSNSSANPWFGEYWESIFNCTLNGQPGLEDSCDIATQALSREAGYVQNSFVTSTLNAVYAFAHAMHNMQQDLCSNSSGLCENISDITFGGVTIQRKQLLDYLHNMSFNSYDSNEIINFDSDGDYQQGGYVIKNLKEASDGQFIFDTIGYWDEIPMDRTTQLKIIGELEWSHGLGKDVPKSVCSYPCGHGEYQIPIADHAACCWECRACLGTNAISTGLACVECEHGYIPNEIKTECIAVRPSYLRWTDWLSLVILILTGFGITASAAVVVIFIAYRKHELIKASSRELSAVLLIGIILCYVLPIFFIMMPSPWTCGVRRFGIGLCFSLCYSALLIKTNRIHRIFNRTSRSLQGPSLVRPLSQLFFTTILVSVQTVIAIVWLTIERPSAIYVSSRSRVELICGESPIIGQLITLGYNFLLLLVTIYFAFRARKVPQNFNEARFINLTVYALFILWLAFILTYYATASLGTIYQTGSLVIAIILNATVTLCSLFVPKVYFLYSQLHKDHNSPLDSVSPHRYTNGRDQKVSSFVSLRVVPSNNATAKPLTKSVSIPARMHRLDDSKTFKGVSGPCSLPRHIEYSTHADV